MPGTVISSMAKVDLLQPFISDMIQSEPAGSLPSNLNYVQNEDDLNNTYEIQLVVPMGPLWIIHE